MRRRAALRGVLRALAVGALAYPTAQAATTESSPLHRAELDVPPRVEVTWLGGPTMIIEFAGLTILTDPVLGAEGFEMGDPNVADLHTVKLHRRLAPFPGVELDSVDVVLSSHIHEDHFDQEAQARLGRTLPIIAPIADIEALTAKGFEALDGLDWGESRQLDAETGRVTITATTAHHSRDPQIAETLGAGNGYWIEFSNRDGTWTMYWTGDTMPTRDVVAMVESLGQPDLMVPNVGGVGTAGPLGQISMGADDVVALAVEIRPSRVLPIHHSTYAFYREPISELASRNAESTFGLDLIAEGGTVVYE